MVVLVLFGFSVQWWLFFDFMRHRDVYLRLLCWILYCLFIWIGEVVEHNGWAKVYEVNLVCVWCIMRHNIKRASHFDFVFGFSSKSSSKKLENGHAVFKSCFWERVVSPWSWLYSLLGTRAFIVIGCTSLFFASYKHHTEVKKGFLCLSITK